MDIFERVKHLSNIALNFNYEDYLKRNDKRLIIFKIDLKNRNYILYYGENYDNVLEKANSKFIESKAGYSVNITNVFALSQNVDLLLLSDELLNSNLEELEMIIIHELIHCLINSNNQNQISQTNEAIELGEQLYLLTDQINEMHTEHTQEFCILLAQACINYNSITNSFPNNWEALRNSMRFDIFE